MEESKNLADAIARTIDKRVSKEANRRTTTIGTVVRVDADGTTWVDMGDGATPSYTTTASVSEGDTVTVTVENGKATVTGNVSHPATDDTTANVAVKTAKTAQSTAEMADQNAVAAAVAASSAQNSADSASAAAADAWAKADSAQSASAAAQTAASDAQTAASSAVSDAATAKEQAAAAVSDAADAKAASEQAQADASDAADSALAAENSARAANDSATSAATSATNAETSATNAQTSASNAETSASNAETSASNAQTSASAAQTSASNAEASASAAATSASNAETSAGQANTAANSAQADARKAAASATGALNSMATVQDVVDTLTWITEHGTMTSAAGTTFDSDETYFVVDADGEYSVAGTNYSIVAEPVESDLSTYYTLSIDKSVQNYLATHLSLTSEGLWITPDSSGYKVLVATGSGSTYTTAGTYIIDGYGVTVAKFTGTNIGFAQDRTFYIGDDAAYIFFDGQGKITIGGDVEIGGNHTLAQLIAAYDTAALSVAIESSAGTGFVNGRGSTTLTCRVYQYGDTELDADGSSFGYSWNTGAATKAITVNAPTTTATYSCEVTI